MTADERLTTRDGVVVEVGQIWTDLDKRQAPRQVTVIDVMPETGKVRVTDGLRKTTLSVRRMHTHSTGYRLIRSSRRS